MRGEGNKRSLGLRETKKEDDTKKHAGVFA